MEVDIVGAGPRWVAAVAAAVYLFALYCSLRGVNFGNHPDEWRVIKAVENSFRTGIFLQRWYDWGSLGYDIGAVTAMLGYLTKHAVHDAILQSLNLNAETPVGYFAQHGNFNLLLRSIVAIFSLSVVLPTTHLTWRLTRQAWPTILSAIIVGFSFQLNYHSRWYTGDALLMLFSFLAVYLSIIYYQATGPSSYTWLGCSAIAAAFAASAKYTGGMFLMAPMLAVVVKGVTSYPTRSFAVRSHLLQVAGGWAICVFAFGLVFALLNPGVFTEPFVFFADLRHVQHLYATGAGTNQDVTSRPENVLLSLLFTFLAAPSPYFVLSMIALMLFCLGISRQFGRGVDTLLVLVVPFTLFFFLLSWQIVFVARNLLPMIPFVAVICGLGAENLSGLWPKFRPVLPALCLCFFVANGSYIWSSARQVNVMDSKAMLAEMQEYIEQHPTVTFSIDKSVADRDPAILKLANARPFEDISSMGDFVAIEAGVYRPMLGSEHRHCSSNRPGTYTWFGPRDSSYEYYSGMIGIERYVLVSRRTFQQVANKSPLDQLICWPLMQFRWKY